jgi:hypothetical protein
LRISAMAVGGDLCRPSRRRHLRPQLKQPVGRDIIGKLDHLGIISQRQDMHRPQAPGLQFPAGESPLSLGARRQPGDPVSRARYAALRRRGHSHGRALRTVGDRLLALACTLLKRQVLFDPHYHTDTSTVAA